ncbi:HvfC/BufC family peptide modification chaperone [Marinomonas sp. PE14-40]|uniref:HvfC/BufC family peptide modification chaperone n=1 Tax=Marinomonas sp. PE14-40 TaxID=3060621 RepID=UPI003F67853F
MSDHEDYIQAFSHFMRSGDNSRLSDFLTSEQSAVFLSIYRNGFYKACLSALKANFTSLTFILDETDFNQIATAYINLYPPSQATLVAYGMASSSTHAELEKIPSFPVFLLQLEGQEPPISIPWRALYDLALLDQTWISTLNKKNTQIVSLAQVQSMLEQGDDLSLIPFNLIESVSLVNTEFAAFSKWQRLKFHGEGIDAAHREEQNILFWQYEGEVQAKLLTSAEAHFYHAFLASASIGDALESAAQQGADLDISALFADLLNASLLKLEV